MVAVSRRGAGPTTDRDALRQHDQSTGAGAAERRARVAQHGGGYAEAVATRARRLAAVERGVVVGDADRLVVSHEHPGDAPAAGAAHQPVARHARPPADESGTAAPAGDLVRARRTRQPAAAPATAYRHYGEPQIE